MTSARSREFAEEESGGLTWDEAVVRYKRLVYSIPRKYGLDSNDADDVFQRTWEVAVTKRDAPPGPDRIVRWLASIAYWKTREFFRDRRPHQMPDDLEKLRICGQPPPAEVMERIEARDVLYQAMEDLPERDRELLRSLFLSDEPCSYAEVATKLDVAMGSVGAMRSRALDRLRDLLRLRGFV